MKISRTSTKAMVGAAILFSFFLLTMPFAENYYRSTDPIRFGEDIGRPWNYWDYLGIGSLMLSVSLVVVSQMFWAEDD